MRAVSWRTQEPLELLHETSIKMRPDAFGDVLEPGEKILVSLGAPREGPEGKRLGWVHVGLTEERFLVAEISRIPMREEFIVGARHAISRDQVSLVRHPRSASRSAHLVITGMEQPLILVDLDRPELFTQLRPFFSAWGGEIAGPGPISLRMDGNSEAPATRPQVTRLPGLLLGLVMGIGVGLLVLWWMG